MADKDLPRSERDDVLVFHADAADGDWIKRGTWDIPASNIDELREWLFWQQMNPRTFVRLPVYRAHVDAMPWLRELEVEIDDPSFAQPRRPKEDQ